MLSKFLGSFQKSTSPQRKPTDNASKLVEPALSKSLLAVVKSSYFNVLLVFIPVSWALYFSKPDEAIPIFITSFLAIIPLAQLLGFATEEISLRTGQCVAGLLNATLGNAVEVIVAIIALIKCELGIVQSSLIGSMLSNLLLVLGMCFFAGGIRFAEQGFAHAAQINLSLLMISVVAMTVPAALWLATKTAVMDVSQDILNSRILKTSHGVAVILLVIYGCYLFFQLRSHPEWFDDNASNVSKSVKYSKESCSPVASSNDVESNVITEHQEEREQPKINKRVAIGLLVVITALVSVTSEALVGSIDGLASTGAISKEFIGLVLLPIVGNAAEHATAVTVSVKDKLTLSISVAVGSSIQIALFVIPFIVTLAWILGKPLTMIFDPFESIVLFLAVITVNYTIQDGKANYMEGIILMAFFIIVATASFFYDGSDVTGLLDTCA